MGNVIIVFINDYKKKEDWTLRNDILFLYTYIFYIDILRIHER